LEKTAKVITFSGKKKGYLSPHLNNEFVLVTRTSQGFVKKKKHLLLFLASKQIWPIIALVDDCQPTYFTNLNKKNPSLTTLTLIMLFSKRLKFSRIVFSKEQIFRKEDIESSRIYLLKISNFKFINQLIDMCQSCPMVNRTHSLLPSTQLDGWRDFSWSSLQAKEQVSTLTLWIIIS
jgi:hypothetical protein